MIRNKRGFKQFALLGLVSAALASGACSDDDDAVFGGDAGSGGTAGSSGSTAGKSNGGKSSAGTDAGGKSNGTSGSSNGGKAGNGTAGTAGTSPTAGSDSMGGVAGEGSGGEPPVMGGEAGMGGEPGMGGEAGMGGGGTIVFATLQNGDFSIGTTGLPHTVPPGWVNEGTTGAAYTETWGASNVENDKKLAHWLDADYTARTYQVLQPIENGTYSFSMWVQRDDFETQYLFARGHDVNAPTAELQMSTADAAPSNGYVKITLSNIVVTSGHVSVGVYTAAPANTYAGFDNAEFVKTE